MMPRPQGREYNRRLRRPHLICAGEAFEDLIFSGLERLPRPGEELRTTTFASTIGGGAVITAVAAARLGLRTGVLSGLSEAAVTRLRREGVGTGNLRRAGEPHAISAALSTRRDRSFVTYEGVNASLPPRLARALTRTSASHVHLAFDPRDCRAWQRRVETLRRRGLTTSWDFGWNDRLARDPHLPALIDALDLVFVNAQEAALYAGARGLRAARAFWEGRSTIVVLKLGAKGSRMLGHEGQWRAPAPRVRAVDTTGAGDAFNGGFLWAWLHGAPPEACLRAGNAVGAASTRRAGGLDALPHAAELPAAIRALAAGGRRRS